MQIDIAVLSTPSDVQRRAVEGLAPGPIAGYLLCGPVVRLGFFVGFRV